MEYTYSRKWSFPACKPRDSFDSRIAEKRFNSRGADADHLIAVAAWAAEKQLEGIPEFVLEVTPGAGFIYTYLLDEWNRICFIYHFEKIEAKMFLFNRVQYTYPDESRQFHQFQATSIESVSFRVDGYMKRKLNDKTKPTTEEWEYRNVDISENWEPVPEFGEWADLGKYRG